MWKVLVVDDDPQIRKLVRVNLENRGYTTQEAPDGETAVAMLQQNTYDLLILDLKLPRMEGLTVLRRMRDRGCATPVLILTASGTVKNRIDGLDIGADDYLVKPFEVEELEARMRALLRRVRTNRTRLLPPPEQPVEGPVAYLLASALRRGDGARLPDRGQAATSSHAHVAHGERKPGGLCAFRASAVLPCLYPCCRCRGGPRRGIAAGLPFTARDGDADRVAAGRARARRKSIRRSRIEERR